MKENPHPQCVRKDDLESALFPLWQSARALHAVAALSNGDGSALSSGACHTLGLTSTEDFDCLMSVIARHVQHSHDHIQQLITQEHSHAN